jgi:hypothetical protein
MTEIDRLYVSTVDVKPRNIDWHPEGVEFEDWPSFWEPFTFEGDDDEEFLLLARNGSTAGVIVEGIVHETFEDLDEAFDGEPPIDEDTFGRLLDVEPYMWGSEGPMMNYWYPLEETVSEYGSFDPAEAAAKLKDVPLCVVLVDDEYGLALTGGGMDLSWEICEAFVRLNRCPPAHFSDLPRMAMTWTEDHEMVCAAMKRSLEFRLESTQRHLDRLTDLRQHYQEG